MFPFLFQLFLLPLVSFLLPLPLTPPPHLSAVGLSPAVVGLAWGTRFCSRAKAESQLGGGGMGGWPAAREVEKVWAGVLFSPLRTPLDLRRGV